MNDQQVFTTWGIIVIYYQSAMAWIPNFKLQLPKSASGIILASTIFKWHGEYGYQSSGATPADCKTSLFLLTFS